MTVWILMMHAVLGSYGTGDFFIGVFDSQSSCEQFVQHEQLDADYKPYKFTCRSSLVRTYP